MYSSLLADAQSHSKTTKSDDLVWFFIEHGLEDGAKLNDVKIACDSTYNKNFLCECTTIHACLNVIFR